MKSDDINRESSHRMNAELGTSMVVTFARTARPIKALFVGMEPGEYIILRLPAGAGVHDHLFEGNEAVVKFLAAGTVYGFHTSVHGYMYKKKLILVVLGYPQSLETHVLRGDRRVDYLVPATVGTEDWEVNGFLVDISTGGCRFIYEPTPGQPNVDWSVSKEVSLTFPVLGLAGPQQVRSQVMNSTAVEGKVALGLKFEAMAETTRARIHEHVRAVSRFFET